MSAERLKSASIMRTASSTQDRLSVLLPTSDDLNG